MYVCMYVCMHVCMHGRMYASMQVCMYACIHVCMYACMHNTHVRMNAYANLSVWLLASLLWLFVYMYVHIQIAGHWGNYVLTTNLTLSAQGTVALPAGLARHTWTGFQGAQRTWPNGYVAQVVKPVAHCVCIEDICGKAARFEQLMTPAMLQANDMLLGF